MVKMTEEPDDYEGPWPEGGAMTEWVMVPREPTEAQLTSMALTYDHGYGLRNVFEREPIRLHMAQLHRAMLEAAPAAPRAGREMMPTIETRAGVPVLVMSTGARPATDAEVAFFAEAERLRAYIANLAAAPAAPQQVEPVAWMKFGGSVIHTMLKRGRPELYPEHTIPLYLHPPAAEVQRLRDAARAVLQEYSAHGGLRPSSMNPLIIDLHRAMEGKQC